MPYRLPPLPPKTNWMDEENDHHHLKHWPRPAVHRPPIPRASLNHRTARQHRNDICFHNNVTQAQMVVPKALSQLHYPVPFSTDGHIFHFRVIECAAKGINILARFWLVERQAEPMVMAFDVNVAATYTSVECSLPTAINLPFMRFWRAFLLFSRPPSPSCTFSTTTTTFSHSLRSRGLFIWLPQPTFVWLAGRGHHWPMAVNKSTTFSLQWNSFQGILFTANFPFFFGVKERIRKWGTCYHGTCHTTLYTSSALVPLPSHSINQWGQFTESALVHTTAMFVCLTQWSLRFDFFFWQTSSPPRKVPMEVSWKR